MIFKCAKLCIRGSNFFRQFSALRILNSNIKNNENDQEIVFDDDQEYQLFASQYFGPKTAHNCLIIHPYVKWGHQKLKDTTPAQQIEEAVSLIRTIAPWKVRGTVAVPLEGLHKKTVFGTGTFDKLIKQVRRDPTITAIFVNMGTLKNVQLEELEKAFNVPIFDRYKIVMEILRLHATSKHAKLQVALAEIPYLRTRLKKFDTTPVIPSGQFETKKLMLQNREQKLKEAIKKLRMQRESSRNRRKHLDYPIVAVVGYTNSGKTSLIKALTGDKNLQPRNQLFATLDVTMHAGFLPSSMEVLYVDTVGFISDIPTSLIECFIATLEDAIFADIIIHVEDLSSKDFTHQRNHVLATLTDLGGKMGADNLQDKILHVGNKSDIAVAPTDLTSIAVSAKLQLGIDTLRKQLESLIFKATGRKILKVNVPIGGNEMRWLYKNATVVEEEVDVNNVQNQNVKVVITDAKLQQFKHYFVQNKM